MSLNILTRLKDLERDLLYMMPGVSHHIQNAIEEFNNQFKELSFNSNTILNVVLATKYIDSVLFDDMVRYMLDTKKPTNRRLLVEKEIKRFIKIECKENNDKVKSIIEDPVYQDRFHYVFSKKQRV